MTVVLPKKYSESLFFDPSIVPCDKKDQCEVKFCPNVIRRVWDEEKGEVSIYICGKKWE